MKREENVVIIDAQMDNAALATLAKELSENIVGIKEIRVDCENGVESSALFALLYSIQRTYPDIHIPMLDESVQNVDGIGSFSLDGRG